MEIIAEKLCKHCGIVKPATDFYTVQKRGKLTLYHRCIKCLGRKTVTPDLPGEIWLPVVGYEGVYEVSSLGRVKRIAPRHGARVGAILKTQPNTGGYLLVGLAGPRRTIALHKLVSTAFHGPCPEGYEVNHKDGVKANCREDNLEYLTHSDNLKHAFALGLRSNAGSGNPRHHSKRQRSLT